MKNAVVVGGSSGIGLAMVKGLVDKGYSNIYVFDKKWNGNSFFDKFYKVQNFFPYAIPIVLDNEPPRM